MVKLREEKKHTQDKPIERAPLPSKVYIPLSQHVGKPCEPQVKVGDSVFLGQKIASAQAHVYSPIHASVSGKVSEIAEYPHPISGSCKAIVIESDGLDRKQEAGDEMQEAGSRKQEEIDSLSPDGIRKIIFEAGIVGLGGAAFPTHIKLNPPNPVETLIINAAECEPYLTGDYRLMVEKTKEICAGIQILASCLKVKKIYVAIEDNKPEAIEKFKGYCSQLTVKALDSFYPQGGEKQLIKNILNKEVPSGKLPFDIGVVVQNVATAYAVYEAAYNNKPLYERVITVSGGCLVSPKNLLVRIGTPIKELIDFAGPLRQAPVKIINGGPMMGIAQYTTDVPVIKSTTAILAFNYREAAMAEELFCIRCGRCIRECPAGLMPCLINLASEKNMWEQAEIYGASDCIECGACNYVCPANRKIVQTVKRAKMDKA